MSDTPGGYARPTAAPISDSWQGHKNRKPASQEPGTDYACAHGSALYAPEDGVVADVKDTTSYATGRYITLDLNDGRRVRWLHLSRRLVNQGDRFVRGQELAKSGASANSREWGVGAHVHVSLWLEQKYIYGPNGTVDFELHVGADNDGIPFDQTTADRQNFLNAARGEKLVVDGRKGDKTKAAYERYQQFLKSRGQYSGEIDGDWGAGTQGGHEKFYVEWSRPAVKPAATKPAALVRGTVASIAALPNKRGLQKIANLYLPVGGKTALDNDWGPRSRSGLQRFLDQNHGGSLAAWLRAKWGYRDRDDFWGPNMAAAAARAEAANWRAL